MKIVENLEQGSPEWHTFRRTHIGASEAPIIMGESPWCSPLQLFNRKLGLVPEQADNAAMAEGRRLEPIAREAFDKQQGVAYTPIVAVHETYGWCSASFDGYHDGYAKSAVEIKCCGPKDHAIAASGAPPKKYLYQLQHQMLVAGLDSIYYYSFDKEVYRLTGEAIGFTILVPRDQRMIDAVLEKELKFYECMKSGIPPELTDRDYIVNDSAEWENLVKRWKNARSDLNCAKDMEELAREELIKFSNNQNCKGCGVKVQKITRAGNVDYSSVPALIGIDLDAYRKPATESWRITQDE